MKLLPLFTISIGLSLPALHGCTQSCTELGCDSGLNVVLPQLAAASTASLTIDVCPGDAACSTFTVTKNAGATECAGASATTAGECTADTDGTVRVFVATEGAATDAVDVHVTVHDGASAVVLDAHQTAALVEQFPNGESCGAVCVAGTVTITP